MKKKPDYENRYKIPRFGYCVVDKNGYAYDNFVSMHVHWDDAEKAKKNMDKSIPERSPHEIVKLKLIKMIKEDEKKIKN